MWGLFVYKRDRFFGEVGGDEAYLTTDSYVENPTQTNRKSDSWCGDWRDDEIAA